MWWEKFQTLAISGFFFLSKQTLTAWGAFCLPTLCSKSPGPAGPARGRSENRPL